MSTTDTLDFFQRHADVVRSVRTHCFASLTLQVWDTILTFADEVDYIWPIPWNYKIKWWYLYFRYVILAVHIAYGLAVCHLTSSDASESACKAWFLGTIVVAVFSEVQFKLMFVIRVYALFDRRRWVLVLLCVLCAVDPAINLMSAVYNAVEMRFDEVCILVPLSKKRLPYMAVPLTTQTILVGIMLTRLFLAVRTGWRRTPLVSLLIREGFTSYSIFAATFAFAMAICLSEGMQVISLTIWSTAILSTCGCRFIINMQRLARKQNLGGRSDPDPVFTSQIEMTAFTLDSTRRGED